VPQHQQQQQPCGRGSGRAIHNSVLEAGEECGDQQSITFDADRRIASVTGVDLV